MGKRRVVAGRRLEIARKSKDLRRRCGVGAHAAARSDAQNASNLTVATFVQLYESPDGKFCLYEDENGHLSAVNTARFA